MSHSCIAKKAAALWSSFFHHPSVVVCRQCLKTWTKLSSVSLHILQPLIVAFQNVSYTLRNSFTIIVMQFRTKWVLFWHREHQSDSECIECSTALVLCCYCMCTTVFVAQRWRDFCNLFEGQVEDWNMATLLRIDALGDVSEQNTVIGMCCVLFTGVFEKCWV